MAMGEAAAKEPTMEDILSSIRKIIAEEGEDQNPGDDWRDFQAEPDVPVEPEVKAEPEMVEAAPAAMPEEPVAAMPEQSAPVAETVAPEPRADNAEPAMVAGSLAQIAAGMRSPSSAPAPAPAPEAVEPVVQAAAEEDPIEVTQAVEDALVDRAETDGPAPGSQMVTRTLEEVAETAQAAEQKQTVQLDERPAPVAPDTEAQASVGAADVQMGDAVRGPQPAEVSEVEEASAFKGALMSPGADGAVSGSFDRLKRSMMDDIEAKTESILRPMLREWLDENLPGLVEKLVREEIERVARGN